MTEVQAQHLDNPRTIHYWSLFDWANSAFALVITTAIFPAYYAANTHEVLNLWGWELVNTTVYAWAIAIAYLVIVFLTPILSGIADVGGRRKTFLRFFTILGGLSCIALFAFDDSSKWMIGTAFFILATIGFAGGLVFYNAFLPLISSEEKMDKVSARGYSYGYIGSVLLLILDLIVITYPEFFYLPDAEFAVRLSFITVGVWWIGFGLIAVRNLPGEKVDGYFFQYMDKGIREVKAVYKELQSHKHVMRFLASFLFYSAGVQAIMYLAATFAEKELGFTTNELIITVLIIQVVAIGGAFLFAYVSQLTSNKVGILIMLVIWLMICIVGYYVHSKVYFYALAGAVGLIMGGIQALSRSTYSKYVKNGTKDITSYFSLYEILQKISIVAGTFLFGLIEQITGSMRNSLLSLAIFFIIGIIILAFTKVRPLNLVSDIGPVTD